MRNKLVGAIALGLLAGTIVPGVCNAQDKRVSGEVDVTGIIGEGQRDSSKFDEYSDRSNGSTGNVLLNYSDADTGDFASLDSQRIGRDDQQTDFSAGNYGNYDVDISYSQIPHRFALGARTLYNRDGNDFTIADAIQSDLGNSTSTVDLARRLNNAVATGSHYYDSESMRKTAKISVDYKGLENFTIHVEGGNEHRDGTMPQMVAFGFSNVNEVVQDLDYDTTQARASVEYADDGTVLSAGYYLSVFSNGDGSLAWDNPYRLTDATSPSAYTNPSNILGGGLNTTGPARGRLSLPPDNVYHGPSVLASFSDLPLRSRLTLNAAWGWMTQDDEFLPFTSNTSVVGTTEEGETFNASIRDSLPEDSPDASVSTQLYNAVLSSAPLEMVDFTAKYRYYNYNNNMHGIAFPGYTRFDSTWEEIPIETRLTSYAKHTAGADVGFRVCDETRLGLGYTFVQTDREKREVDHQKESTIEASVDHRPNDWADLRLAYRKGWRDIGPYNFRKPFGEEENPPQLPYLRKYEEADREVDEVHFVTNVAATEDLGMSGSFIYGQSDYDPSHFGLLDDRYFMLSGDVDYRATEWASLRAYYTYEEHNNRERARQWNPAGPGDPFLTNIALESNSDWTEREEDRIHTIGAGTTFTIVPKSLFFDLEYAYTDAYGDIDFSSPLGTVTDDANPFVPSGWNMVDRTILQRVNPSIRYRVLKNVTVAVGYLWEKFDFNDFAGSEFSYVPTTASGAFNGALLNGTYPFEDYEVNLGYVTVKYRF